MDALDYLASVGGVARVGLLRATGYAPSAIRKLASAGAQQPRKGIWALPSADPEYLTAILNDGKLTCASAALRYGLWIKDKPRRAHLATRHCRGRGFVPHGGLRLSPENAVPVASVERKDMARLNAAQARGFVVLSFAPETIWNNPEQVMEEIRAILARDTERR